jgi:hypothetical protein
MTENTNDDHLEQKAMLEQQLAAIDAQLLFLSHEEARRLLQRDRDRLQAELAVLAHTPPTLPVPPTSTATVTISDSAIHGTVVGVNYGSITHTHTYAQTPDRDVQARDFMIDILSQTYRQAFGLNFTTRFVKFPDYKRVRKSIKSCRVFLQKNLVRAAVLFDVDTMVILQTMLRQLHVMETVFKSMEPYARNPEGQFDPRDSTGDFLLGRVDGTGQPGLEQAFVDVELVRIDFLLNTIRLAQAFAIELPELPNTPVQLDYGLLPPNHQLPPVDTLQKRRDRLIRRKQARRYLPTPSQE